jgi:predicted nuclease with TOPRIM domain
MSEARIEALAEAVTEVRIEHARLRESVDHLAKSVSELSGVVQGLRDNMNKGRGALMLLGGVSAAAGGLISWATTLLFRQS